MKKTNTKPRALPKLPASAYGPAPIRREPEWKEVSEEELKAIWFSGEEMTPEEVQESKKHIRETKDLIKEIKSIQQLRGQSSSLVLIDEDPHSESSTLPLEAEDRTTKFPVKKKKTTKLQQPKDKDTTPSVEDLELEYLLSSEGDKESPLVESDK